MAKYRGYFGESSGSVGGTTFSRNRGGAYQRARVIPVQPNSSGQLSARNAVALLSRNWGGVLTPAQRTAWGAFAKTAPLVGRYGSQLKLTGEQMYVRCNAALMFTGDSVIADPPANLSVVGLATLAVTMNHTGPVVSVAFTTVGGAATTGHKFAIYTTGPVGPGIGYDKPYRKLLMISATAPASPLDVETEYTAMFGAPTAGQHVFWAVKSIKSATGAESLLLSDEVTVA